MSENNLETIRKTAEVTRLESEARIVETKMASVQVKDERVLSLYASGFGPELVVEVLQALSTYQMLDAGRKDKKPIHMNLNVANEPTRTLSPYIDMFAVVDYIRLMQKEGFKFTMQVTGMAAQQAACLLQVADERLMTAHSRLMFSEEEFGFRANSAESRKMLQFHKRLEECARQFVCKRSKVTMDQFGKGAAYKKQWWIGAKEALALGLIDQIDVRLLPAPFWTPDKSLLVCDGDTLDIRKAKAEARKDLAIAAVASLEADIAEAALKPGPHLFVGGVTSQSCLLAEQALLRQARTPGSELSMIIYSHGGSVIAGAALLDVIKKLKEAGHKLTTTTIGCAASMGGFLLAAGDVRNIGENARVLIHRISSVIGGGTSEAEDQERMMTELEQEVIPMLLEGSTITTEEYMTRTEDGDWWLEATEALDRKIVHKVL